MYQGIDVSSIQNVNGAPIDWAGVKAAGYEFVIVKNGNGNDSPDPCYQMNITGAQAAGLYTAQYHFAYPLPTDSIHINRDPVSQAKFHYASSTHGTLTILDLEWPTSANWSTYGCTGSQICQWAITYLQTYDQLNGRPTLLYTYPDFCTSIGMAAYPQFANWGLWIASYEPTPTIPAPFTGYKIWQTTGGGAKLPGSGVPVDTNCVTDLSLWTVQPTVTTQPLTPLQPLPTLPITSVQPITPIAPITPPSTSSTLSNILQFISNVFK